MITEKPLYDMQMQVFRHIRALGFSYHEQNPAGNQGRVAEQGTHLQLMAQPHSIYSKLVTAQHEEALTG